MNRYKQLIGSVRRKRVKFVQMLRGKALSNRIVSVKSAGDRPWWKSDINDIYRYFKEKQFSASEISLASLKDIGGWPVGFRILVIAMAYMAALFGGVALFCGTTQSKIRAYEVEIQLMQTRCQNMIRQVALMPEFRSQIEIILTNFGELLDAIPAAVESVHVLSQINQAANSAGLQLEYFKPQAEETQAYYVALPVEIRLRGSYSAIAKFMELVSKMKHLITVDVVILPSTTHPDQIVLASSLKAYRYRQIPDKQVANRKSDVAH